MGLLTKMIQERPQFDVDYTVVKLVSRSDNKETAVKIIDECYSKKGLVVKTVELESFEGEYAAQYNYYLNMCFLLVRETRLALQKQGIY